MPDVLRTALVPFSAEQMYLLVCDVDRYHEFLPWCRSSHLDEKTDNVVIGTVDISVTGFKGSFTTKNVLTPFERVDLELVKGPFSHLNGFWQFDELIKEGDDAPQGCKVTLSVSFKMSNRVLNRTVGPILGKISNTLINAFCQRARDTYGK